MLLFLNVMLCYVVCQQDCSSEVEMWHDDVRFYKIFNKSGKTVFLRWSLNVPIWKLFQDLSLSWSHLWINRLIKQKL